MKVWLVHDDDIGGTTVYNEGADIIQTPFIKRELGYLVGGYEEEREEFIADVQRARDRGRGSAHIEDRLYVELVSVD
jgi:hypothetical protein